MAKKKKRLGEGITGSRAEKLAAVVQGANKEYGRPVMCDSTRANEMLVVPRVTTGLYGLDVKTNGGLPFGRAILVYGPAKGGKTTMLLRGVGQAQKLCANCYQPGVFKPGTMELPDLKTGKIRKVQTDVIVNCPCGNPRDMIILWIDAEGVWLPDWVERMGVQPEKVILSRPSYGEQAYNVVTAFVSIKEIDLIAIDSLAQLTPVAEYDASMEEQQQGAAARMNNKFIRKVISGVNEAFQEDRMITLWAINQYREKIGVMFGSPDVLPGGKGQLFMSSLELELRPGTVEVDKDTGEAILGKFKYKVVKNKIGVGGGKGEFSQCMSDTDVFKIGDLMEHEEVIDAAVRLGIVVKPSSVMYEYAGEKFRGKSQLVRFLGENKEQYEDLKDLMLRARLGIDD
jgi:recombination protein RecA